jgi:hypothetical protein
MSDLLKEHESPRAQRTMEALLCMKKLDIRGLERAAAGDRVTA